MIALLQRVTHAQVEVDGQIIGAIDSGLMVLVGVQKGDTEAVADKLLSRLLTYRVFADEQDKMNLSVTDVEGGLLLVPQFTLAADTRKGRRPSFSSAASPADGETLFNYFCKKAVASHKLVERGQFGADMKVGLTNDGPVTFWLEVESA